MSLDNFKIKNISRLVSHTIIAKTEKSDAYSIPSKDLLNFSKSEKEILIDRIEDAILNSRKTFKLEFEDKSDDSIYAFLKSKTITKKEFYDYSVFLASELADAHFRTKIPGGFCLVGEATTIKNQSVFFIIKAELQQVFNIENNKLKLIKDVFLSPAKDFYKIGLFVTNGTKTTPYMYDDQFSMQKRDLTEYFYGQFLGLTTDRNDGLRSKNFYKATKEFIDSNVDNIKDKVGLTSALRVTFREDTSGILSAKKFSDDYLEGELKNKYDKKVASKFPQSFTKDTKLLENKPDLSRITIPLQYSLFLVGNENSLQTVEIIEDPTDEKIEKLQPEIDDGTIDALIVVREKKQSK